ncbi:MAG: DUF3105 domain-containing protein [Solirubrobacterales bacterium]
MASRKEERERLRAARREAEERQQAAQRKRLLIGYGVAGLLTIAVAVGVVIVASSGGGGPSGESHINTASGSTNGVPPDDRVGAAVPAARTTNLRAAARRAGCVLRLHLPDEGHTHVAPGSTVKYDTNPPTSGNHVQPPDQQADGAYLQTPAAIDFVHSMEHGRMLIEYNPQLSEREQLQLKGLYDTMYVGTLLFPDAGMPYEVAATTWTNLLGCKTYEGPATLDAIRAFGKATWGRYGGEPVNGFGPLTGPDPTRPSA